MFRNQYDNDVTVFSPQGRLFQLEYAQEAVKQGAPTVGLSTPTMAVLCALRRRPTPDDLSATPSRKLFALAPHTGCAIAGLTSDARVLTKAMFKEALASRMDGDREVGIRRLVEEVVGDGAQRACQYYGGRPYGVGLLVIGRDTHGVHLMECGPSGQCVEYVGWAIGARAQSARTYLEGLLGSVEDEDGEAAALANLHSQDLSTIIRHSLAALRECLPPDQQLSAETVSIGCVTIDTDFTVLSESQIADHLDALPARAQRMQE